MAEIIDEKIPYSSNAGSIIRKLLNGVKHNAQTFCKAHGLKEPDLLERIMKGEEKLTTEIEEAIVSHPGINRRDLYPPQFRQLFPIIDDTFEGVKVMGPEETESTKRGIARGPKKTPYYIYADTSLSNISTLRPEWIKELYVHNGNNTNIPDWGFNKGHFEHQITYFIGHVNFYWIDKKGKRYVRKMDTGDTNYIVPFVPHTFTTREEGAGLILAVTYGGTIAREGFQSKISEMSIDDYLNELKNQLPNLPGEIDTDALNGVKILEYCDSIETPLESYTVRNLVSVQCQPYTKIYELGSRKELTGNKILDREIDSDIWGYNLADSDVVLLWGGNYERIIRPGSSFFIKSGIKHCFRKKSFNQKSGKLLLVEIQHKTGDHLVELALINKYVGEDGLRRVHTETMRWY